jgi:C-terminal processing protease CtpA/Prc
MASATASHAEDDLRQQLWDRIGVELKKPIFCKCVEVAKVGENSLAQKLGMQKGDRWLEDAKWIEISASSTTMLRDDEFAQQVGMSKGDGEMAPVLVLGGGNGLAQKFSTRKIMALEKALLKIATYRNDGSKGYLQLLRKRNSEKKNYTLNSGRLFNGVGVKIESSGENQEVLVREVMPGLPADQAGLRAKDHILSVNDDQVQDAAEFSDIVRSQPLGTVISIRVRRGEKQLIDFLVKTTVIKVDPEGFVDSTDDE